MDITQIENVCFKGGGMKGNSFIGVHKAFTELNLWPQIKRFIGSSAGAIFASAIACKIPYEKIEDIINNTNFTLFQDSYGGYIGEGYTLWEYMGVYRGQYFYDWFKGILDKETGNVDITFKQVYEKYGNDLTITTVDLTKKKLVYMNKDNFPNMKICDAVRKSMSIPVFFIPVIETDETGLKHVYVDGGCLNNFPLDYYDNLYPTKQIAITKTIGFNLIDDSNNTDPSQYINQTVQINNVIDLISTLINTDIEEIERLRLSHDDIKRTVNIDTFGIKSTDFNLSRDLIKKLIHSGYISTIEFFKH
jgi:NTE family protein